MSSSSYNGKGTPTGSFRVLELVPLPFLMGELFLEGSYMDVVVVLYGESELWPEMKAT